MKSLATHRSYIAGFVLSVLFTLAAYQLVVLHTASGHSLGSHPWLIGGIVALGTAQLVVQLVLFLHLGREAKPRWQVWAFGFMVLVLVILVAGSLWIMKNLNYHMVSPTQTDTQIMQDEGIYRSGDEHGGHHH